MTLIRPARLATLIAAGLASACASLPPSAYKEAGGCHVTRYNKAWLAAQVNTMQWDGPCVDSLASGRGTLTVSRKNGSPERYQGPMLRGTFDTSGETPDAEYIEGSKRWLGAFRNGRFIAGQLYVDGKLDYDGSVYPSMRYNTGKTYFSSGRYIDGTFTDTPGSLNSNGLGVYKGIVYSPENQPEKWIFLEKAYKTEADWGRAMAEHQAAEERKARNEAMLTDKLDTLFGKLDAQVTASPGSNAETMAYYGQRRDVAQSKVELLDKLIGQCKTSQCDYQDILQQRRSREYDNYRSHAGSYESAVADRESAERIQALSNALEQVALNSGYVDAARYNQAKAQQQSLNAALNRLTTSGSSVETAGTLTEIYSLMRKD